MHSGKPTGLLEGAASAPRSFPFYVLPVEVALAQDAFPKHEDILSQLVEWKPGMGAVAFFSHTWLGYKHPDPRGEKWQLLKTLLGLCLKGTLEILPHPAAWLRQMANGGDAKLRIHGAELQRELTNGYVWVDYACVPQEDSQAQGRAIASLASYVSDASYFIVLAGAWVHADNGSVRDKSAWAKRGWCRLECLANALSLSETAKPIIMAESPSWVVSYSTSGLWGKGWIWRVVGDGDFTVEADRTPIGATIKALIQARKAKAIERGTKLELIFYRVLCAATYSLLRGTGGDAAAESSPRVELRAWLDELKFESPVPRIRRDAGPSPILLAVLACDCALINALLDAGANVNAPLKSIRGCEALDMWERGMTPLHLACLQSDPRTAEVIALLLRRGAAPSLTKMTSLGQHPLHGACNNGSIAAIDAIMAFEPSLMMKKDSSGFPPAHYALEGGHPATFRHLRETYGDLLNPWLASGCSNLNKRPGSMRKALTFLNSAMIQQGEPELLKYLIEIGCKIDSRAQVYGVHRAIVRLGAAFVWAIKHPPLLLLGIYHTGMGGSASSCLHAATLQCSLECVQVLIDAGVDLETKSYGPRMTALHLAARFGHVEIARALVAAGASLAARDAKALTPSQVAARAGHDVLAADLCVSERAPDSLGSVVAHIPKIRVPRAPARVMPGKQLV